MNIFDRTRKKREQDAGLEEKSKPKQEKKKNEKTMSQAEFSGYKSPPQSKKWIEK